MEEFKYKLNYLDTPQSSYNGFISTMRNVYLTSSIGIALFTFSRSLKKDRQIIYIISLTILLYSIIYGIKTGNDFNIYLNFLQKQKDMPIFLKEQVDRWYTWIIFTYFYTLLTIFLFIFLFYKKILI